MYEVEAKAKAKKGAEAAIKKIARRTGEELQEDTYFSHPCRDFAATDEALRIRNVGGKLTLTYKGPKIDRNTKSRKELETPVQPEMFAILKSTGFQQAAKVSKVRTIYTKGSAVLSIDRVDGLGTYIEVEAKANSLKDFGKAKKQVLLLLEALGYSQKDSITTSYLEMLLEKRKN